MTFEELEKEVKKIREIWGRTLDWSLDQQIAYMRLKVELAQYKFVILNQIL